MDGEYTKLDECFERDDRSTAASIIATGQSNDELFVIEYFANFDRINSKSASKLAKFILDILNLPGKQSQQLLECIQYNNTYNHFVYIALSSENPLRGNETERDILFDNAFKQFKPLESSDVVSISMNFDSIDSKLKKSEPEKKEEIIEVPKETLVDEKKTISVSSLGAALFELQLTSRDIFDYRYD